MVELKKCIKILGTNYRIEKHKFCEDVTLQEGLAGYCSDINKLIVVVDMEHESFISDIETEAERDAYTKEVMRHEILHAFFNESGLKVNSLGTSAWSQNEEMIDWFAIQFPKINKVYEELNIL